ncbi:carbohydrate ABC transporter permease [Glycomyces artemisiae]|uniref:Multiple sugar transport system permease protein n=1 Tax=Glycomyces artemisiae TaxID=1076443 RepID=A0A2T0UA61_9ACTN|nr:sugar ABC transporter permease [Glycomyces artemisiae]PRY54804.1 multiple sugar transport system permease protein [Glycomyces artemisiae]
MSTDTADSASAAPITPRSGRIAKRGKGGKGPRYARTGYLFVAPFMIAFTAMFLVPLAYAAWFSFFREQMIGGNVFVGFDNYTRAFSDPQLMAGLGRVALFFLIQVPLMMALALFFALALDSALLRLARTVRLAIFMPYAVPSVVAALMWGFLYGPDFGPIAQLADKIGATAPDFLGNLMLGSIANIVTWEFTGYNMILLYAALRAIPTELYEAAAVDGAGPWRTAWSIKIPLLRPALVLCMVFSVIGSFQLFNEPSIMRTLAPNVIVADYTPNLYAYNLAFVGQEYNYAAAVSFVLGFVIMAGSYLFMLATNRRSRS